MAYLKNLKYFSFDPLVWGDTQEVIVGHNRKLLFGVWHDLPNIAGTLHDNIVAQFEQQPNGDVLMKLNTCGWLTVTTCAAINEFMGAMGISGGVTRVRGAFGASYRNAEGDWVQIPVEDNAVARVLVPQSCIKIH